MSLPFYIKGQMTVCEITEFDCPNCGMPHDHEDYENDLNESGRAVIECVNCDSKLCVIVTNDRVSVRLLNN